MSKSITIYDEDYDKLIQIANDIKIKQNRPKSVSIAEALASVLRG